MVILFPLTLNVASQNVVETLKCKNLVIQESHLIQWLYALKRAWNGRYYFAVQLVDFSFHLLLTICTLYWARYNSYVKDTYFSKTWPLNMNYFYLWWNEEIAIFSNPRGRLLVLILLVSNVAWIKPCMVPRPWLKGFLVLVLIICNFCFTCSL